MREAKKWLKKTFSVNDSNIINSFFYLGDKKMSLGYVETEENVLNQFALLIKGIH